MYFLYDLFVDPPFFFFRLKSVACFWENRVTVDSWQKTKSEIRCGGSRFRRTCCLGKLWLFICFVDIKNDIFPTCRWEWINEHGLTNEVNSKREWVEKHFDLQNIKEQLPFGKFGFRRVREGQSYSSMLGYCLPQSCNSVLKRPKVFCLCLRPDFLGSYCVYARTFIVSGLRSTWNRSSKTANSGRCWSYEETWVHWNAFYCLYVFFWCVSWCFCVSSNFTNWRDSGGFRDFVGSGWCFGKQSSDDFDPLCCEACDGDRRDRWRKGRNHGKRETGGNLDARRTGRSEK